jgi:RHS repeat-associated protein
LQPGKSSWAAAFTHFVDVAGVIDYTYDDEGRMEFDANKSLNFVYNHLDLVKTASSGTEVNFIWDATGRKIAKTFGGHITHYIGGVEYLDDVLISIATAEGIVRKTQLVANEGDWVYDYYLKDHLGSIRAVITNERSAITADKVTSETAKRLQEEMGFDNVDETAGMAPYLYPYDPSNPDNEMVAELNAYTGRILGPSKMMSVRAGETIDLSTNYWYHELPGENPISDLTEILAGILLNMGAASSGIIPAGPEAGMALLNNVNGTQFNALSGFLDDAFDEVDLTDPQAYLVYMFFDKNNMKIISEKSGIIQVGEADQLGVISQKDLIMDRDGFFYVYVTNRSQLSVSFDNLEVKRWKPVVRVAYDYYPYGLTWENPALPGTEEGIHDCTYQDKEFQFGEFSDGHGLALYDFHARMYDGATGRWLVPDPAAQFANPYLAMGNNPVIGLDPDGRFVPILIGFAVGAYIGSAMAAGHDNGSGFDANPFDGSWKGTDWYKGMVVGGCMGAAIGMGGMLVAGTLPASPTLAASALYKGILGANIGMLSSLTQGKDLDGIYKSALVGSAAGVFSGLAAGTELFASTSTSLGLQTSQSVSGLFNISYGVADGVVKGADRGNQGADLFLDGLLGGVDGLVNSFLFNQLNIGAFGIEASSILATSYRGFGLSAVEATAQLPLLALDIVSFPFPNANIRNNTNRWWRGRATVSYDRELTLDQSLDFLIDIF